MAEQYLINDTTLTSIADAIRAKYDDETKYLPREMPEAIRGIAGRVDLSRLIARTVSDDINDGDRLVSYVGSFAFTSCVDLKMVSFPAISKIYEYAFAGCTNLASVYLMGSSQVSIDTSAFYDTPLDEGNGAIYVPSSLYAWYSTSNRNRPFASCFVSVEG